MVTKSSTIRDTIPDTQWPTIPRGRVSAYLEALRASRDADLAVIRALGAVKAAWVQLELASDDTSAEVSVLAIDAAELAAEAAQAASHAAARAVHAADAALHDDRQGQLAALWGALEILGEAWEGPPPSSQPV